MQGAKLTDQLIKDLEPSLQTHSDSGRWKLSFEFSFPIMVMGRSKRNVLAAAEETSTPPSALTATQSIARVIKAEGNSLYSCSLPEKKTVLVELLPRFRNTIWIKRGGYVVIDTKEASARDNKIDGEIVNVVRDEHLWRKESYW